MSPDALPQIVPQERCLRCDVCCRFPEEASPLRPYFTDVEIARAVARGVPAAAFPDHAGSRIELVAHPTGHGYLCPAFDPSTNRCTIYDVRPFDCQLYPFALMRPPQGDGLLLGWDRLCPYLRAETEPMVPITVSAQIARQLQQPDVRDLLARHPGLVGGVQETVWVLEPLESQWINRTQPGSRERIDSRLRPVEPTHAAELTRLQLFLMESVDRELSARHAATLLIWQSLMAFFWAELEQGVGLVAEQAGGYFAPVPPVAHAGHGFADACRALLALLDRLNRNPALSRIERLSTAQGQALQGAGLRCRPQGEEYLYDRQALAQLRGDRYKSPRWSCNQAQRRFRPQYGPCRSTDLIACLRLYAAWRRLKERTQQADGYAAALLADSFYAHWQTLAHAAEWELAARVVRVDGDIRAYAVGAPLTEDVMVIFHEVADPRCPGLGPWLFREWCREFTDVAVINAMDDSGLSSLRATKARYRPIRAVEMFQVTV